VRELLKLIELEELGGRYPRQLSGGQMQRVAVARALASNPRRAVLQGVCACRAAVPMRATPCQAPLQMSLVLSAVSCRIGCKLQNDAALAG
jgi:ABC-type phosphonate transport system ATPase subunit